MSACSILLIGMIQLKIPQRSRLHEHPVNR
jgi:hypothetical protein